jgi:hypothetical protein
MIPMRFPARLSALMLGGALVMSCDTLPTSPTGGTVDDTQRPQLTFRLSGGVNNTVALGTPLTVSITATDNKGVASFLTTIRNSSAVLGVDTATIKPAQVSVTRIVAVPLAGVARGDRVTIRTTITDVGANVRTDSIVVSIANPTITFDASMIGAKVNVGDSILVKARLQDAAGLDKVVFKGFSLRGDPNVGRQDTVVRYASVGAPSLTTSFPIGVTDTVVSRYIFATVPIDTVTDSLVVTGELTDLLGGTATARTALKVVRGPSVIVLSPTAGDSATPNAGLTVTLRGRDGTGVARMGFRMQGASNWPTKLDTTLTQLYPSGPRDTTFVGTVQIPGDAPLKSLITITPVSLNAGGQEGASAPTQIAVRAGLPPAPRVFQQIAKRIETVDSVTVTASGNGLTYVGYELRDSTGVKIVRDSIPLTSPYPSNWVATFPVKLASTLQGRNVNLRSFAYDQGGRIGYSLRSGATTFEPNVLNAQVDTALVVYGRTYPLPSARNGTIADLAIDQKRGNVFLSSIDYGRLEVWQRGSQTFDPNGIVVGSQPWGMALSRTAPSGDTLYVANSGGTNLSRVFIGGAASGMREDLANRLLTRVSFLFRVTEVRDQGTGRIRLTVSPPILFSDRPQFVEQSKAGRLYISTKPTLAAPTGTVRYLDPAAPAPDERFILAFASRGNDPNSFLIANVDNIGVTPAPANSSSSDLLTICDHPTGTTAPEDCVSTRAGVMATIDSLKAYMPTTDLDYAINADEKSIGFTDTTFAASSGDGQWIGFGEGNKTPFARALLLRDDGTVPDKYTYASPSINVADLINNASDVLYGLALDSTGKTLGVHAKETYFAAVSQPFTQRLQGKKTTFANGAGIAFHPQANGVTTAEDKRLAFVAAANGSIELIDIAYYDFNRGNLATKANLYGPLRASLPFPGDDPSIVLKLFGLSSKGLVVIDVTASDIKKGP